MESRYTKKERHQFYIKAYSRLLFEAESDYTPLWICPNLPDFDVNSHFPEFGKFQPSDNELLANEYRGWWPDRDVDSRIKALNQCIEQTKPF